MIQLLDRRVMTVAVVLLVGVIVAGGCKDSDPTVTPLPPTSIPRTSTPTSKPSPTATASPTPTPRPTSTPTRLGPLPTPPPTPMPAEVNVEIVAAISSEPARFSPPPSFLPEPDPVQHLKGHTVVTLYVTEVVQGKEHISPGDTIIFNAYYHLASGFLNQPLQPGMAFRLRSLYRVDTGVVLWVETIEELNSTTAYEPPPVVGRPGDVVRVTTNFSVPPRGSSLPAVSVGNVPHLRLIDENWAEVVLGTVHLGQVVGDIGAGGETAVEILRTPPFGGDGE